MEYQKSLQKHLASRSIWGHILDVIIITIISFSIGVFLSDGETLYENPAWHAFYAFMLGGTLWKGSEFISVFIYSRINILERPARLILYNSVAISLYVIVDIFLINFFFYILYFDISFQEFFTTEEGWVILFVEFVVALIINFIFFTINFFKSYIFLSKIKRELESDKMALEFQTLRDQVNPHFLFNSLNTLSALVDIDRNKAQLFISELSKVYRYVLDTQKDETIHLKDEILFVDSFVYLNKLRLGENLIVNNHLESNGYSVIPLAVQMLVENAIKHNIASSQKPLSINITKEDGYILVENTYQPKESINEQKVSKESRLGLDNLKFRYRFLTHQEVIIKQEEGLFKVYLPLIEKA